MTSEQKCGVCGKKAKRPCPALAGWICPSCCGSHRGSKINCSKDCSYFPFGVAAFDTWLKVDNEWLLKAADYGLKRLGKTEFNRIWKEESINTANPDLDQEASLGNAIYGVLFVRRDATGRTLADVWESEGWAGLNNDEQLMMRFRRRSLVTVIELQKNVDRQTSECIDLFEHDPRPFRLFDRALAARAPRFTRLLVWLTHYPHFSRTSGFGYPIPLSVWPMWKEQIQAWTTEESQRKPGMYVREFLSENLPKAAERIHALTDEYRRQLFNSLDAHHCVALYEFTGAPAEIESVLKSKPEFKVGEPRAEAGLETPQGFYHWLREGESAEFEKELPKSLQPIPKNGENSILANVWFYPNRLMIEASSKLKYEFVKKLAGKYFDGLVRFQGEQIVDLAKQIQERRMAENALLEATAGWREEPRELAPAPAAATEIEATGVTTGEETATAPPELIIQQTHDQNYRAFLDDKNPALDGWTPRAASKVPKMRTRLAELMKLHLHNLDRQNREKGIDLRLDWVLDELGLPELK
jgi:hypothetical protein